MPLVGDMETVENSANSKQEQKVNKLLFQSRLDGALANVQEKFRHQFFLALKNRKVPQPKEVDKVLQFIQHLIKNVFH
jgi:hypothetical protein